MREGRKNTSANYWMVYGEASGIYHDPSRSESRAYNDMQKYLADAVRGGLIKTVEKCEIAADIMRNADPQMDYDLTEAGF